MSQAAPEAASTDDEFEGCGCTSYESS